MQCTKCGYEVSETHNFCGNCGISLSPTNSVEGDGSVNIVGSNTISNSHLHVGDVYQTKSQEERAYIDRTYIKPITLGGSPVKTSWLIISGVVGLVGSCASIFSVLGSSLQLLFLAILVLSVFFFMNGVILWKTRFSRLNLHCVIRFVLQ